MSAAAEPAAPLLSLVIPAHNEELRLPQSLPQAIAFAAALPGGAEILVVDNASTDRTRTIAEQTAEGHPDVRVLAEPQRGKGAAVRRGALAARGQFVFFADADLSMPIEQVERFLPPALDTDVAIGSREAPGARRFGEPPGRHRMGRLFNGLVRAVALPGIRDSQCGFKCFRRAVAQDLFARQTEIGWAFDVELLLLAQRLGYQVVEVPIDWHYRPESRVHPLADGLAMALAVVRIRLRHRRLARRPGRGPAQRPPSPKRRE